MLQKVGVGFRSIGYGMHLRDKLNVAARLGVYSVFPLGSLARRVHHPLPDPSRWLPAYTVRCADGVFECPSGPEPYFLGADRTYEPALVALLQSLDAGTFVDIGANVGFITVRAARRLQGRGLVIAFEPHPIRFEYLQRNIRHNQLDNVRAQAFALGAAAGIAELYDVDPTLGPRSRDVTMTRPTGGRRFQVAVRTLDAALTELGGPADIRLVKIDVEGYEAQVLAGMPSTLQKRPRILFEALDPAALREAMLVLPSSYRVVRLEGANYLATPQP